jgi:hypothetical protein
MSSDKMEGIVYLLVIITWCVIMGFRDFMKSEDSKRFKELVHQAPLYKGVSKTSAILTFLIMIIVCLFPPFKTQMTIEGVDIVAKRAWGFIFDPPKYSSELNVLMSLDLVTLTVELIIIGLVGGVAFFVSRALEDIIRKRRDLSSKNRTD